MMMMMRMFQQFIGLAFHAADLPFSLVALRRFAKLQVWREHYNGRCLLLLIAGCYKTES